MDEADWPEEGKVFISANPWPLAAIAKRKGFPTDRFRESDLVPEGQVLIVDVSELPKLSREGKV